VADYLTFKDISEDNGAYDMSSNTDQLIAIRMSTGVLNRFDLEAAENYTSAHAAGKRIIQYHYCGNNDPTTEAKLFVAACSPFAQYDMYCIDAELGQSKAWKQTFADYVKQATGCNVIDYMNISTANAIGALPDCALWLAAPSWGFDQTITELNKGIEYLFQQGPVVDGVDTNAAFTTIDVLDKYGYQEPAPTTTTTTTTTTTSSTTTLPPTATNIDVVVKPKPTTPSEPTEPVVGPQPTTKVSWLVRFINFMKGKKTYTVGVMMVITSLEKYHTGQETLSQFLTTVQGLMGSNGLAVIAIRAAISKAIK
jgi:hypothetical protein